LGDGSTAAGGAPSLMISGAYTVARAITVGSVTNTAAYNATIGGSNTTGTSTYSGAITLNTTAANYTATLQAAAGGTVDFTGAWTTNNKAIAIGSSGNTGTVKLSNALATSGGISVNYGTLLLGASNLLGDSTPVTVAGGILNVANVDQVGAVTLSSGTISGAAALTGSSYSLTNTGTISAALGGSGVNLTKTGTGKAILSGANTYSGVTTIGDGTLQLAVSGSIANSPTITVGSGAVLEILSPTWALATGQTIKGTGTITGSMTVASGSFLSPGTSPGALAETGTQTWAGGGTYVWEVDQVDASTVLQPGKGADPGYDFLNITGTLAITATSDSGDKYIIDVNGLLHATHALGAVGDWDNTKSYTWVIATASDGISGFNADKFDIRTGNFTANNAPAPTAQWKIAQSGDTKSIEFQYVTPEPATMALLGIGGAMSLVFGRRRARKA